MLPAREEQDLLVRRTLQLRGDDGGEDVVRFVDDRGAGAERGADGLSGYLVGGELEHSTVWDLCCAVRDLP